MVFWVRYTPSNNHIHLKKKITKLDARYELVSNKTSQNCFTLLFTHTIRLQHHKNIQNIRDRRMKSGSKMMILTKNNQKQNVAQSNKHFRTFDIYTILTASTHLLK